MGGIRKLLFVADVFKIVCSLFVQEQSRNEMKVPRSLRRRAIEYKQQSFRKAVGATAKFDNIILAVGRSMRILYYSLFL